MLFPEFVLDLLTIIANRNTSDYQYRILEYIFLRSGKLIERQEVKYWGTPTD